MRSKWIALSRATAVVCALGGASPAYAFHDGGTGSCSGCHIMHSPTGGAAYLLAGPDPSSTCLHCHAVGPGDHVIFTVGAANSGTPPSQFTPGGDFGWLRKDYRWSSGSGEGTSAGERKGHNVVAKEYSLVADSTLATSPGGNYAAEELSCISCHDPHGRFRRNKDGSITTTGAPILGSGSYASSADPTDDAAVGVYRLLGGIGYRPASLKSGPTFQNQVFAAVAPDSYNRAETDTQTRVAYGVNVSEWCANCHDRIHTAGSLTHPADERLGSVATTYNAYVKTADLTGTDASSYQSLVPFQESTADYAALKAHAKSDGSSMTGPTSDDKVMCLSCHRAHATGWDSMTRWNMQSTFLTVSSQGVSAYPENSTEPSIAQGRTFAEYSAAFYRRPATVFAPFQRSLCNKCHGKD